MRRHTCLVLLGVLAALAHGCAVRRGGPPASAPSGPPGEAGPWAVDVRVVPRTLTVGEDASGLLGTMTFEVTITNGTGRDVLLVDDPSLPGLEATPSSLTLHFDVEDFPEGTDANVNVFRVPSLTRLTAGGVLTKRVEVRNPVRTSNWVGIHWDTSANPPTHLRSAPSVTVTSPMTLRATVGWGTTPFEYTTETEPQDERLAFLAWQRRARSAPQSVAR